MLDAGAYVSKRKFQTLTPNPIAQSYLPQD